MDRRNFLKTSASVSASGALGTVLAGENSTGAVDAAPENLATQPQPPRARPVFIATWPFGVKSTEAAIKTLGAGGSMLDAIEKGIWVTESDMKNVSVGIGGIPNADGQVELDACIMSGPGHSAGSVAAIREFEHPISVARDVMEKTPHVMIVGDNAGKFAESQGHQKKDLLSEQQKQNWQKWLKEQAEKKEDAPAETPEINEDQHDTIAMLGVDEEGNLFGGCSTSGWGFKIPGRVGDSPIIGGGLYVDNEVGAAGATGLGENVMRYCGSFLVVEFMRQGNDPTTACKKAIERIESLDPLSMKDLSVNFIAINKAGEYGAAGTNQGFRFAVTDQDGSEIVASASMTDNQIGPEGGNRKED